MRERAPTRIAERTRQKRFTRSAAPTKVRRMPQNQKPMVRKKNKVRLTKRLAKWRAKQEADQTVAEPAAAKKK